MTRPSLLSRVFPDPRVPVLLLLVGYLILGFTVLGFNRNPLQVLVTCASACALEFALAWLFYGRREFPLSALITGCGLSLLLNYSHGYTLLAVPVFFAIGAKYVFQYKGRHVYNPAMIGVVLSLLLTGELITSAPAYQWNGIGSMAYFVAFPAMMLFMPSINRLPLVGSFLAVFTLQCALRGLIMRHHLPFITLFLGTMSSPSFLLFTFFMITDPKTSPEGRRDQVLTGAALAVVDLLFHLKQSYYTFFYASFTVASVRLAYSHIRAAWSDARGGAAYAAGAFYHSGYFRRPLALAVLAAAWLAGNRGMVFSKALDSRGLGWRFEEIPVSVSGVDGLWGGVYEALDPRIQHIAKWVVSIGDAVAVGDFDGDGRPDLFFTQPLKRAQDRCGLYRNLGGFKFQRVAVPALEERSRRPERHGLPTSAMFADYDNDGDSDLFVTYAFGGPALLQNRLKETGRAALVDVTREGGLDHYTNSVSATFADLNRDGRLDLVIANVLPTVLPGYAKPTPLNLFKLPEPAFPGDRRMFDFMHSSWNNAANGGDKEIYLQDARGRFAKADSRAWGLDDTGWTMVVGAADLDRDGWPDLYLANDFGPDRLYYNDGGRGFRRFEGSFFGSVGRDTYKGMNVSIEDFDRNGWLDVYVSNVHHDLQAEGSLLWAFSRGKGTSTPAVEDRATSLGALNERRFGWGAASADYDNNGWVDIAQANGMVDDSIDKKWDKCPDYWYINEKLARSPPSIHRYADRWGDLRGACIHGSESDRLYLNRGDQASPRFRDAAAAVGLPGPGNSRAMAAVDLDGDGRLDLVVTHAFRAPTILRNAAAADAGKGWLALSLSGDGKSCGRDALGSRVAAAGQIREVQAITGFGASGDRRVHFGLGDQPPAAVSAEVSWCGGLVETFANLETNRGHRLVMGRGAREAAVTSAR